MSAQPGTVYLVGGGPGDPGLITVRGAALLATADAVLYDALSPPELLRHARPDATLVNVGKRAGRPALSQEEINQAIVAHAIAGQSVVRLKGGDPFVFGRGGEEALACWKAEVPFEVVPGVTSAIAGPAYAGIPVTHRGIARSFMVLTAREGELPGTELDYTAAARAGTLVILMGLGALPEVLGRLIEHGLDPATPAACISQASRPTQRAVTATAATLANEVAAARLEAPALTVVGPVVGLAHELHWRKPGRLAGRRVVVTRAREQASNLTAMLEAEGAEVIEAPVIRTELRAESPELRAALDLEWDWVVFSSQNAVEAMMRSLFAAGHDARALAGTRIAAVGPATARALRARGIAPDFVPSAATGAKLAEELPSTRRSRILYPCGQLAGDALSDGLRHRGAAVTPVIAYDTVAEPLDVTARDAVLTADAVTFASGSSAHNLAAALGSHRDLAAKIVAMGPETSRVASEAFGRVDAVAAEPSLAALVEAVVEVLSEGRVGPLD